MGERKFCYKCMEQYDTQLHVCPNCGYDDRAPHNPMYIAPGTILREKYLFGVLLDFNGDGATYAAYDISAERKLLIREYMPINLCTRVKNKPIISVNYNNLAKYKAFMAEYTELNQSLARLRNNTCINNVIDMFAENNTTYTVFEYIDGIKILDYIKENAGEISWEQVSKIFPPLFTTIGMLHNAGIIHRAISPDTVYITNKGELKLSGFCVSAVRTADAGLEYELFKGYAAPEQYSASSSSRQGSWTDVYGICALLYRALTGCMPVDALSRLKHDDLHEPCKLNPHIPQHVSRVIMEGMNLSGRDRIQTITELVTKLFEQPVQSKPEPETADTTNDYRENVIPRHDYTPQQQPTEYSNTSDIGMYQNNTYSNGYGNQYGNGYDNGFDDDTEEEYRYEKVNTVDRLKVPVIIGILLLAILMIIAVLIFRILYNPPEEPSQNSSRSSVSDNVVEGTTETQETTLKADIEMPDLQNKFYELTKEKWSDYFTLDPTYDYNDDYDNDMIYEQSIEAGTMIAQGTVVKVKVSKGNGSALIPDFKDSTVSQYKNKLEQAGISDFNYQFIESKNAYGTPNTIIELQVDGKIVTPGSYFNNKEGKKLTVYYIPEGSNNYQETTTAYVETTTAETTTTTAVVTEAQTTAAVTEAPTQAATEPPTEPPTQAPTEPPTEAPADNPPEEGIVG